MRFNEFDLTEDQKKEMLRTKYPHLSEEQLDEILPAIGAIAAKSAAAAGRVGAKMGTAAAKGAAKVAGNVAKQVGAKAVQGAKGAGQKMAQKVGQQAMNMAQKQLLKRGAKLSMPTQGPGNQEQEFEIDAVKGDEVVINNPKPKPGEPLKTVYKKKDLEPIIKQKAGL